MNKLRRSRIAKVISGVMILILAALIVANIVGAIILMEENLYYASREQIQQKVYSYLYNYTASDLMQYLNMAESMHSNNDNYKNYHYSELELYRSKYSADNSNIYFEITDEKGNLLLKNTNAISSPYFSFSSIFASDCEYSSNWFIQGGSGKAESVAVATTPVVNEPTDWSDSINTTEYSYEQSETSSPDENSQLPEEHTVQSEEIETTVNTTANSDTLPTADTSEYSLEEVTVFNINSDNSTKISYYYKNGINFKILGHCKDIIKNLNYDITEISIYQDDFSVYEHEDWASTDHYIIKDVYGATDESVPTKSFTTTLLCNGKKAVISYSYNGTINFNEFQNRLSLTSLIMENTEKEQLNFDYNQKSRIQIQVKIHVPYVSQVNDIYKAAEILTGIAIIYRNNIVLITVTDALLFILSFVFIFWSAGYIPKIEKPVARGLHRIPFDIYTFLTILAAVGCFAMISVHDELFIVLGFIGLAILLLGFIYTLTVRIRTETLRKNNLCYKIYSSVKSSIEIMSESTGSKAKIVLISALFLIISLFECLCFAVLDTGSGVISIIIFIIRLVEIPFVVVLLISLLALHNAAKAISKGDVSYRIKNSFLFGPLKKHAEYLNSINGAVNNAVAERMRSESLKTELITNVSHDLKTPLTSIVSYVDLLKKVEITNPQALQYIEVIDRQSQRLKKLTVDIVEASKAATGNIEVHREKTALNVIVLQTNGEYIERLEENNLTLIQEIPENDIIVSTDGRILWRIIDNLMNNICKYSMPGTRVYLSLYENDGNAFISFKNISKEKLNISPDTLTERFVRGDTSRNTEGSGLGLSIANSLAEVLEGELSIEIDGDLFKVTLSFPTVEA